MDPDSEKKKKEQANTEKWLQKQAKKKNEKEDKQGVEQKKAKKKDKNQKKQENAKKQEPPKKQEQKPVKKDQTLIRQQQKMQKQAKKVMTVESQIFAKNTELHENRSFQENLILKSLNQLLRPQDNVLHLPSNKSILTYSSCPSFNSVYIPSISLLSLEKHCQILCRYQDIALPMQSTINKLIIEAQVLFKNGSILTRKGYLNLVNLAQYYRVKIIVISGSWRYCGRRIYNQQEGQAVYGEQLLEKFDFIPSQCIDYIVLESGALLPSQLGYNVTQGYRNYGINTINW